MFENITNLPVIVLPFQEVMELSKKENFIGIGKYYDFVKPHPLELGTDGEFRYAYSPEKTKMTDPNTTVSGTDGSNSEPPIPKFENNSSASPTSGVDTKALAKEVAELLRPDFEKVAQSTKDKRIAAIEKRLGVGDLAELEG